MRWFVESAKRYQLTGRPLEELCEHNATVALNLQRHQVSLCGTTSQQTNSRVNYVMTGQI